MSECLSSLALSSIPWKMDVVPKLRMRQEAEGEGEGHRLELCMATRGDHVG